LGFRPMPIAHAHGPLKEEIWPSLETRYAHTLLGSYFSKKLSNLYFKNTVGIAKYSPTWFGNKRFNTERVWQN
jgi:hypothetical protein